MKARAQMYQGHPRQHRVRKDPPVSGQASRSKVVASEKKKADAKLRAKNRAAKVKRDATRAAVEDARERRNRQRRASYYRYRIRLSERRVAQGKKNVDAANNAVLKSDRNHSAWRSFLKARERTKELLAGFKKNLAVYKTKLAALQGA